jgi:hypothetical protein
VLFRSRFDLPPANPRKKAKDKPKATIMHDRARQAQTRAQTGAQTDLGGLSVAEPTVESGSATVRAETLMPTALLGEEAPSFAVVEAKTEASALSGGKAALASRLEEVVDPGQLVRVRRKDAKRSRRVLAEAERRKAQQRSWCVPLIESIDCLFTARQHFSRDVVSLATELASLHQLPLADIEKCLYLLADLAPVWCEIKRTTVPSFHIRDRRAKASALAYISVRSVMFFFSWSHFSVCALALPTDCFRCSWVALRPTKVAVPASAPSPTLRNVSFWFYAKLPNKLPNTRVIKYHLTMSRDCPEAD